MAQAKITPEGRGVVVMTNDFRFFSVSNFADPKVRHIVDVPLPAHLPAEAAGPLTVSSWAILSNDRSGARPQ